MRNKKIYSSETLNNLRAEIIRLREERKNEVTLDKVLIQSKKEALELIALGCTSKEIANIYERAGIQVSLAKIKQTYFSTITKKRVAHKPKISLSGGNQG